jgi:hypothetical protein
MTMMTPKKTFLTPFKLKVTSNGSMVTLIAKAVTLKIKLCRMVQLERRETSSYG